MHDQAEKLPGSKSLASFCEKDDSAREFTKELRSILEVTAATGRYWHEWAQLKVLLSFRLSQVLRQFHKLQYPDGAPTIGPFPPGREPFEGTVERLVQYLDTFTEGAPFTFQRLCEILLNPNDTYKNLDKLALAFEKILLVQSTYPPSSDPYPLESFPNDLAPETNGGGQVSIELDQVENGNEDSVGRSKEMPLIDEEMVDVDRVLDAQAVGEMASNTSSDMQDEPSVAEITQAGNATSTGMLDDSAGVALFQAAEAATSQMVDNSSGEDGGNSTSVTTSQMLLDPTNIYAASAAAPSTNTEAEMMHESTDAPALPQAPDASLETVQHFPTAVLPPVPDANLEMVQDSLTSGELNPLAGSNADAGLGGSNPADSGTTDMLQDSAAVELAPSAVPEAVASSTGMLQDAAVVGLLSAAEERITSADIKPPGLEADARNDDNLGMKGSGQEGSVNNHVQSPLVEDKSEDVSMGIVG